MGLPSGSDIHSAYLFWWVSKCDRAFGPDQAAGERSLYIPRQASATGKIFIHQFFIFSTGTFHRRYLSLRESLTCRLVLELFTGTVDIQYGSKPGMESSGQHYFAIFPRRISRFSRGTQTASENSFDLHNSFEPHFLFSSPRR